MRVPWMPDTELEELDVGELFSAGTLNRGAAVIFQIELRLVSGQSRWITVEHLQTQQDTYRFPVWRKWAPQGLNYQIIGWGGGSDRTDFQPPRKPAR